MKFKTIENVKIYIRMVSEFFAIGVVTAIIIQLGKAI